MISRRSFASLVGGAIGAAVLPAQAVERRRSAGKRGCCFVTRNPAWRERVDRLSPDWMYSWGSKRPETLDQRIDFTPMVWGQFTDERFNKIAADLKPQIASGRVRHLLGFNEPDQAKQSNLTVEKVIELWPRLMELGVPLISPGCVHPDREWMHDFMEQVEKRRLRVDAIAVHSYGGPSAEQLMRRLERVAREFGRPVWITEFAVGDWDAKSPEQNKHSPKRIAAFMKELLPTLNAATFVERYAWFSASQSSNSLGTSALFDDSGELTPLGEIYANA